VSSPLLKKIKQNTLQEELDQSALESLYQTENFTGREKLKSNKSFTEWLLSPSLYPSDERILSHKLIARRSSDFKGSFYSLETSRATYTFFCPSDAALKLSWPRLKALWSDFSKRYPGRVLGVRFLRTVGELPIWLDDEAVQLRVNTPVRQRGEIACLIERRIVNRVGIETLSERGFYQDEMAALAELVDLQQSAHLNYQYSAVTEPVVCDVSSELLPYELLLKEVTKGIEFEPTKISCKDLELLTYEGGTLAWGIKSESSREEILCALRKTFGASFVEHLSESSKSSISQLAFSLSSYRRVDDIDDGIKLRRAVRDLIVGPKLKNVALVVIDQDEKLSLELGQVFETSVISDYNDVGIGNVSDTFGAVAVVQVRELSAAPKVVQSLKAQGMRVLTIQKGSDSRAGILDIFPRQNIADQAIEVLRGISNTLCC
jgi:hypothetical protein